MDNITQMLDNINILYQRKNILDEILNKTSYDLAEKIIFNKPISNVKISKKILNIIKLNLFPPNLNHIVEFFNKYNENYVEDKDLWNKIKKRAITTKKLVDDSEEQLEKSNNDVIDSIKEYTSVEYGNINDCIRNSSDSLDHKDCNYGNTKQHAININQIFKNIPKTEDEIVVYRTLESTTYFDVEKMFDERLKANEPSKKLFEDRSFQSTSLKKGTAQGTGDKLIIVKIIVPKDSKLVYIGSISEHENEKEVLLGPGYSYIVQSKSKTVEPNYDKNQNLVTEPDTKKNLDYYTVLCENCNTDKQYKLSNKPQEFK